MRGAAANALLLLSRMGLTVSSAPHIVRVRHEVRRRLLIVARVEKLAPKMVSVTLKGDELHGFTSLGFDDHVKVFLPASQLASDADPSIMRDFTPRRFDAEAGELTIDFYIHDGGPAATWAAQATPGQTLAIGGPKGSSTISLDGIALHLLIGDETALPAIGRRLEELPGSTHALVVVETESGCVLPLSSRADLKIVWVARQNPSDAPAKRLIETMRTLEFSAERCFAWAAAETHAARAIRDYLISERGLNKQWINAAGYWRHGALGVHEVLQD